MRVIEDIPNIEIFKKSAITIGSFDGVHLGHKELFDVLSEKRKDGLKTVVVTFFPNPKAVILKNNFKGHINSKSEKINLLKDFEVDLLCILKFDEQLKQIRASAFLNQINKAFNPSVFVLGYNHFFGHNREGDLEFLKKRQAKYSFSIERVLEKSHPTQGEISSSNIRTLLLRGEVKKANSLLGYSYHIKGQVIKGDGLGKKLNFPTANLQLESSEKMLPKKGVYFIKSKVDNKIFFGMCNIGVRPTISNSNEIRIEVHFFDMNMNLYGKTIKIYLLDFIRSEMLFNNLKSLKKQLELDRNKCLEYSINNV